MRAISGLTQQLEAICEMVLHGSAVT